MLLKGCTQYASKFRKLSIGQRTAQSSVFIPIPNYRTIVLISPASKAILKILQARLQQYVNQELPDVQVGFRKVSEIRDQIVKIHRMIEKAREFKNIHFCFFDYANFFDCVDHNKLWKILQEF